MRGMLLSLTFALLALPVGCQSEPQRAPGTEATTKQPAQSKKTKFDLAMEAIKKRGGAVQVDVEDLQKSAAVADLHGFHKAAAALESLAPLTKLHSVNLHNADFNDADLELLRGLPNLQTVNLSGTKITDEGLPILQTLPNLHTLVLNETRVSDAGMQYLRAMPNLSDLSLYGTKVTDEGVAQLRDMTTLTKLVLGGSNAITNRSVTTLAAMSHLHNLTILSSRVTEGDIQDLQLANNQLKVVH